MAGCKDEQQEPDREHEFERLLVARVYDPAVDEIFPEEMSFERRDILAIRIKNKNGEEVRCREPIGRGIPEEFPHK